MQSKRGLNPKQQRFVAEYLKDLNATQAAIRAGYSERTARQVGSENLSKPDIACAIAQGQAELAGKAGVTAEKIVTELAKLGFSNMQDYVGVTGDGSPFVDLSGLDRDKWAAVGEVTVDHVSKRDGEDTKQVERIKFKLADKRAALVDLGKHLGMFVEKHEHTVGVAVTETIRAMRDRMRAARAA